MAPATRDGASPDWPESLPKVSSLPDSRGAGSIAMRRELAKLIRQLSELLQAPDWRLRRAQASKQASAGRETNMRISRRAVLAGSASVPLLAARVRAATAPASITIHSGRHRGAIDRKIFGNFIEHLGRCIEGGIFQEGSPLSDKNGFRKDVLSAAKQMNVPLLRWPGGN